MYIWRPDAWHGVQRTRVEIVHATTLRCTRHDLSLSARILKTPFKREGESSRKFKLKKKKKRERKEEEKNLKSTISFS